MKLLAEVLDAHRGLTSWKRVTRLTAILCVAPGSGNGQAVVDTTGTQEITVTDKSFGCLRDGTKVRNTYIRNADPKRLAEAVRILRDRIANTEYPVGTVLQLVPGEAMVKHPRATFPATNGWEFFALDLSPQGTKIKTRGDNVVNFQGVPCLGCHKAAATFDFVCEKDHGCAPIPLDDKKIAERQGTDPRCPAKPTGREPS
jgi:hypothetical protein